MPNNIVKDMPPRSLRTAMCAAAVVNWLPPLVAYVITGGTHILFFTCAVAIVATLSVYISRTSNGDWLMLIAYILGILCDFYGFESQCSNTALTVPKTDEEKAVRQWNRMVWLVASLATGVISALFCKTKDVYDGRYRRSYFATERLYVSLPAVLGECTAHLLACGWRGFTDVFAVTFLMLATVGMCLLIYRVLAQYGVFTTDLVGAIIKLFTSSFALVLFVVCVTLIAANLVVIPLLNKLFEMNTLLSSFGVAMEVLFYDIF
eukprot:PhM_4_TR8016/c0_g2_i1/m.68395